MTSPQLPALFSHNQNILEPLSFQFNALWNLFELLHLSLEKHWIQQEAKGRLASARQQARNDGFNFLPRFIYSQAASSPPS